MDDCPTFKVLFVVDFGRKARDYRSLGQRQAEAKSTRALEVFTNQPRSQNLCKLFGFAELNFSSFCSHLRLQFKVGEVTGHLQAAAARQGSQRFLQAWTTKRLHEHNTLL